MFDTGAPRSVMTLEFARKLGVADGDLTKMRQEVRENLEREVRMRLKNRVKDQVMQGLLDVTQIEVPKSLVEMEIQQKTGFHGLKQNWRTKTLWFLFQGFQLQKPRA